jgi:hypothetical protein
MSLSGRESNPAVDVEEADALLFPPPPPALLPSPVAVDPVLVVVVPCPLAPGAMGAISMPVNDMLVCPCRA